MAASVHQWTTAAMAILLAAPSMAWAVVEVSLSTADASFLGESMDDQAGLVVADAGDVNADGLNDFLIAAPSNDESGTDAGQVYLLFGATTGWSMDTPLSSADASVLGEQPGDLAGTAIAGGGDVNGDGYDDLLIGAPFNDDTATDAGKAYLLYGAASGWEMDVSLEHADASFLGDAANDWAGLSTALSSDINCDGFDDLFIGAPVSGEQAPMAGQVYILFGGGGGWSPSNNLSSSDASYLGENQDDLSGFSLGGGGDFDGDGCEDAIIGAPHYLSADLTGKTYLLLGKPSAWTTGALLSECPGSFEGENSGTFSSWSVDAAGDVNGDGWDDLVVGAPDCNCVGSGGDGKAYLVHGGASWVQNSTLASADASFLAEYSGDGLGWVVAGAGDYNADLIGDLLLSVPGLDNTGNNAGSAYLVLGTDTSWSLDSPLSNAHLVFVGESPDDFAGYSIAGAGDVNGDGADDLLVSSPFNDECATDSGQVYLLMGQPCLNTDNDGDGWSDCQGDCDDNDPLLQPTDADGDGLSTCGGDCDDSLASVFPGAPEICDGIPDNDCDGSDVVWDSDNDGDGWTACMGDCDDADSSITPHDNDGDGYTPCDLDCDDEEPYTFPGAEELCDGEDNDCDGSIPTDEVDEDGDNWSICEGDCDDTESGCFPGATEICDGLDNNCDGPVDDVDQDEDGHIAPECGGDDCDDTEPQVNPTSPEDCGDNVDNDCDGHIDEQDDECAGDDDIADDDSIDDDSDTEFDDDTSSPSSATSCQCRQEVATPPRGWWMCLALSLMFLTRRRTTYWWGT